MRLSFTIMREGPFLKDILSLRIPAIVSNYATEHIPKVTNLVSDHEAIGRMAAQHLLERGFTNLAFCGYPALFWSQRRFESFEACAKQAGITVACFVPQRRVKKGRPEDERAHLLRWLLELPKPVGLMACIDERSQQVAEVCQAEGICVPEEIAIVVGFSDAAHIARYFRSQTGISPQEYRKRHQL